MPLLRQREVVAADEWQTLADSMGDTPPADDVPLIVPFATFRENAAAFRARKDKLGIRLSPADKVEDPEPELPRVSLVALELTGPGEGRGYSQAKLRHSNASRSPTRPARRCRGCAANAPAPEASRLTMGVVSCT
jgi:uncharacterized protein (DUF934 family)